MAISPNLRFTLVSANQSQKEITVNNALITLDSMLNNGIIDATQSLPENPQSGDMYIIQNSQSIASKNNNIAWFYFNSWQFIEPKDGCTLWLKKISSLITFSNGQWVQSQGQTTMIQTNTDADESVCKLQPINTNLVIESKANFSLPTKIRISSSSSNSFAVTGTNEKMEEVQEIVSINNNEKLETKNWFLSVKNITAQTMDASSTVSVGNISTLITLASQILYVKFNSDVTFRIQQTLTMQEYRVVVIPNQHQVTWEQHIEWHNISSWSPFEYNIITTQNSIIGMSH